MCMCMCVYVCVCVCVCVCVLCGCDDEEDSTFKMPVRDRTTSPGVFSRHRTLEHATAAEGADTEEREAQVD